MSTMATSLRQPAVQQSLPAFCPVEDALERLAEAGIEERGAIFTRREVVEFIFALGAYTPDQPLHSMRLLEPSFGEGDFLLPAVQRLLEAYRRHCPAGDSVHDLRDSLRAVELHKASFKKTRRKLLALLIKEGLSAAQAAELAAAWLRQADFLLTPFPEPFTHVVGNPPYVRQELIPDALIAAYRERFHTIFDRADLSVALLVGNTLRPVMK